MLTMIFTLVTSKPHCIGLHNWPYDTCLSLEQNYLLTANTGKYFLLHIHGPIRKGPCNLDFMLINDETERWHLHTLH